MLGYRRRISAIGYALLQPHGPFRRGLDFGAGDGRFARHFQASGLMQEIVPVETVERARSHVRPLLYDGLVLPFADRSFDVSYSIDAFHHCADPCERIRDVLRCTNGHILIKDHTYGTAFDRLILCLLDEIGNRPFGIRSPYNYQRGWEWFDLIAAEGFVLEDLVHPAHCHPQPLAALTDPLHFIALWRRSDAGRNNPA